VIFRLRTRLRFATARQVADCDFEQKATKKTKKGLFFVGWILRFLCLRLFILQWVLEQKASFFV